MTQLDLEGWVFISGEVRVSRGESEDMVSIELLSWREWGLVTAGVLLNIVILESWRQLSPSHPSKHFLFTSSLQWPLLFRLGVVFLHILVNLKNAGEKV